MGLKEIREISQKIQEMGFGAISDPEFQEKFDNLITEMDENWDVAKERLCQNHTEEEIAELMNEIRSLAVSNLFGGGMTNLLRLELSGELKAFGDTYCMAVIGALIMEGIL